MFEIVDKRSKVFSTSFIQLSTGFLENDSKMHCGCKFAKQELVTNTALLETSVKSTTQNTNTVANVNTANEQVTMASIGDMLKMNNLIMNQIEQMLAGSYNNQGLSSQQAQFQGIPVTNVSNKFAQQCNSANQLPTQAITAQVVQQVSQQPSQVQQIQVQNIPFNTNIQQTLNGGQFLNSNMPTYRPIALIPNLI
jgi:hypothetical protein